MYLCAHTKTLDSTSTQEKTLKCLDRLLYLHVLQIEINRVDKAGQMFQSASQKALQVRDEIP